MPPLRCGHRWLLSREESAESWQLPFRNLRALLKAPVRLSCHPPLTVLHILSMDTSNSLGGHGQVKLIWVCLNDLKGGRGAESLSRQKTWTKIRTSAGYVKIKAEPENKSWSRDSHRTDLVGTTLACRGCPLGCNVVSCRLFIFDRLNMHPQFPMETSFPMILLSLVRQRLCSPPPAFGLSLICPGVSSLWLLEAWRSPWFCFLHCPDFKAPFYDRCSTAGWLLPLMTILQPVCSENQDMLTCA